MVRRTASEGQVQAEVRILMDELTTPPYMAVSAGPGDARFAAIEWLTSLGYVVRRSDQTRAVRLTPEGWGYWERLRLGPTRYWVKHNWFPVAVAVISSLTGIGAIIVGVLTLLLND